MKLNFDDCWTPEPNSGCWLWTRATDGRYGWHGRIKAHRKAWTLYRGEIPEGLQVLHHCDTPLCVNPEHLFLGTPADNKRGLMFENPLHKYAERGSE